MVSENKDIPSLGALALQYGTVTKQQLQEVFAYIKSHGKKISFADALIKNKAATKYQVDLLLLIQDFLIVKKKSEQFGKIAIEKGFAAPEDVAKALAKQQQEFKKAKLKRMLGDILVESGVITQQQQEMITREQEKLAKMTVKTLGSNRASRKNKDVVSFKSYEKEFLQVKAMDKAFASIVIEKGYATSNEIKDALKRQDSEFHRLGKINLLGDIMIAQGTLTKQQKNINPCPTGKNKEKGLYHSPRFHRSYSCR